MDMAGVCRAKALVLAETIAMAARRFVIRAGLPAFERRCEMNRKSFLGVVAAAALVVSTSSLWSHGARAQPSGGGSIGSVYTMTNAASANEVVIFARNASGALARIGAAATGGAGSGGGLDPLASQGSLMLADNDRWLLAVNAGSNDVSVFRVDSEELQLVDKIASGGVFPTSLAVFQNLVYVLNAGGIPNISGFMLNHRGHLAPIAGSTRVLPGGLHSQVGFDRHGNHLIVTDRATSSLIAYPIGEDGVPASTPVVSPSHGPGPFAFVVTATGNLLVAEVGSNAVSSYEVQRDGTLRVVSPSVPNGQAATCWIATAGSRHAFTANPGTSSFSGYRQQPASGEMTLLAGVAGRGAQPLDLAASAGGRFLYALDPGIGGIDAFQVEPDGSLIDLGAAIAGLPLFAQGLAVR
jgi:6-phosphogluconolactonase (cycloisomerase 2 family)